jgi:hypothetical protein
MNYTTERTEAARAMGRAKTEKKAAAVRKNGMKGGPPRRIFSADDITADAVLKIHFAALEASRGLGALVAQVAAGTIAPAGAAKEINILLARIERAARE